MKKRILILMIVFAMVVPTVANAENPDTTGWFEYSLPDRSIMRGTALDASYLLDAPAGRHGYIKIKGDNMFFEDGTPARFWGTNIAGPACFFPKANADKLVDIVATSGYNMVRFHHMDSTSFVPNIFTSPTDTTGETMARHELNPEQLDRFEYLWSELKKEGVYFFLDFMTIRHLSYDDAINLGYSEEMAKVLSRAPWAFTSIKYFEPNLQDIQKTYMRQLLTHRNPYTGTTLAEDPAFAACCIANEDSLFIDEWVMKNLYYKTENNYFEKVVGGQFAAWLKEKYGTDAALAAAWSETGKNGVQSGDSIANGYVYLPNTYAYSYANQSSKKIADIRQFFREKQAEYYENMYCYLKEELGVKALVSGSNTFMTNNASGNTTNNITDILTYTESDMDILDQHGYYGGANTPSGAKNYILDNNPISPDVFVSMLKKGSTDYNFITFFARRSMVDKPMFQSEWDGMLPNEYLCDMNYQMAAYSALHGWNPIQFNLIQERYFPSRQGMFYVYFSTYINPSYTNTMTAAAHMMLGNHIAESDRCYTVIVDEEEAMDSDFQAKFPDGVEFAGKTAIAFEHLNDANEIGKMTGRNDEIEKRLKGGTVWSDTGQLGINDGDGIFIINAPKTRMLSGFTGKRKYVLGDAEIQYDNEYAAVALTSLDDKILNNSSRFLITATAGARNKDYVTDKANSKIVEAGTDPILIEPVNGTVKIKNQKNYEVWTLSNSGIRLNKIPTEKDAEGNTIISINGRYKTCHYEVVEKAEASGGLLSGGLVIDYNNNQAELTLSTGEQDGDTLVKITDDDNDIVYFGIIPPAENGVLTEKLYINGDAETTYTISARNERWASEEKMSVAASPPGKDYRLQKVKFSVKDNKVYADAKIINNGLKKQSSLWIAAYDGNGILEGVTKTDVSLSPGLNNLTAGIEYVPLGRYKLMMWDEKYVPLLSVTEY